MKKEKEKAVIYARYSSSGQREESIEGQIRECRAYAERSGFMVVTEYTDHALTGRTDKRPGFQRMIRDAERGLFSVVICWKMDRFARNRYDSAIYKARLKRAGVRLLYAMEAVPEGPEGIILESVMEGYAEYYSRNLAQNVKRGMYENARALKVMSVPLFGYRKGADGKYEIDPITSPAVKRIFRDALAGVPMKDILAWLKAEGYKTARGKAFTASSLYHVLKNEKYTGLYEYADIRVEDGIPALVSREDFEEVKKTMGKRKQAPAAKKEQYLLSMKLRCGECGAPLIGEYATSKNGKRHFYYTCRNKRHGSCQAKRFKKAELEKVITDELIRILFDDAFISELIECVMEYQQKDVVNDEIHALELKKADVERRMENLASNMEEGPSLPFLTDRMNRLADELEGIEKALGILLIENPMLSRDELRFFLESLRKGDVNDDAYKLHLVDTFLQEAVIYEDKTILSLNYSGRLKPARELTGEVFELDSLEWTLLKKGRTLRILKGRALYFYRPA